MWSPVVKQKKKSENIEFRVNGTERSSMYWLTTAKILGQTKNIWSHPKRTAKSTHQPRCDRRARAQKSSKVQKRNEIKISHLTRPNRTQTSWNTCAARCFVVYIRITLVHATRNPHTHQIDRGAVVVAQIVCDFRCCCFFHSVPVSRCKNEQMINENTSSQH